jgi:hypothetical protein
MQLHQGDFSTEELAKYGNEYYVGVGFEGGALLVLLPTTRWWSNIDNIAQIKLVTCLSAAGGQDELPLPLRKCIRDTAAKLATVTKAISTSLGVPITIEVDHKEWHSILAEAGSDQKDRFPGRKRPLCLRIQSSERFLPCRVPVELLRGAEHPIHQDLSW